MPQPEPQIPKEPLIPKHGGYRSLKSFQMAQLIHDVTARFCDLYVDPRSRTHDQMVQAARSGVQNIAEGSQASGTSKKSELKLTNVARASLEELRLDYEDFLRQQGLQMWEPRHPALARFKAKRCSTVEQVRAWVKEERQRAKDPHGRDTDGHGPTQTGRDQGRSECSESSRDSGSAPVSTPSVSVPHRPCSSVFVRVGPCHPPSSSELVANAVLSLLNLCCYLLDRQLAAQAQSFEKEGGFTERLYHRRQTTRRRS